MNGGLEGPPLLSRDLMVRAVAWRIQERALGGLAVTAQGFAYDDKTYGSLTKVARVITGAHWSGPRFFGLNVPAAIGTANDGDRHG